MFSLSSMDCFADSAGAVDADSDGVDVADSAIFVWMLLTILLMIIII